MGENKRKIGNEVYLNSMTEESIMNRFEFARKRLICFQSLNDGDIAGANSLERQQLIQDFFSFGWRDRFFGAVRGN